MPATTVVILERYGRVAARIVSGLMGLPVRLEQTRSPDQFAAAIAKSGPVVPIAIIELEELDTACHLLRVVSAHEATSLIVGYPSRYEALELRERGAACLIPPDYPAGDWHSLLGRLVHQSQEHLAVTG